MSNATFTVFCRQSSNDGTTHIDTVEAEDVPSAILAGRQHCLRDWNSGTEPLFTLEDIHCLGIAAGNVTILHWEDPTNTLI
jgi:hypothetical protein